MGLKVWAYVVLAGILITGLTVAIRSIYNAGYDKAIIEAQEAGIRAQNEAIDAARADWIASQEDGAIQIVIEERIVEVTRDVIKEIPVVVERIVEVTPECSDLGPDFLRLFNEAIDTSPDPDPAATRDSPDPPARMLTAQAG